MGFEEVVNTVYALVSVAGAIGAYFAFRGRRFGYADLALFLPLAVGADWLAYGLLQTVATHGSESAAYGGLVALLLLLGLLPVAAAVNVVAAVATVVCLVRYPAMGLGLAALIGLAWLAHLTVGNLDDAKAPGGTLNGDRLAGEAWALESGAATREDCDRQSSARAFRDGCYSRLGR